MSRKDLLLYYDKRIASIFLLGIISGLPWVMIGSALTLWLQEAGVSRSSIGFAGLIFFVYSINFFWSPLIDRFSPRLGAFSTLGAKQSWIVLCQAAIAICCFAMSQLNPETHAKSLVLMGLALAAASATQDIAIDAYRIQSFPPDQTEKISAGAAAATGGWWTGYAGIGFIPLALSDLGLSWSTLYLGLGCLTLTSMILCALIPAAQATEKAFESATHLPTTASTFDKNRLIALLLSPWIVAIWAVGGWGIPEAFSRSQLFVPTILLSVIVLFALALATLSQRSEIAIPSSPTLSDKVLANTHLTLIKPLQNFFQRNGAQFALTLLGFIFLFKLGEAFLGRMSLVFYKEIGFTSTQIAFYSKTVTWGVTLAAAIPAGIFNARLGLFWGLMISGLLMALSNLLFSALAMTGPLEWLYGVTVVIDGFTAAWATVAFVAFISRLCDLRFSATQYALLASLGNFGRSTLSSNSGLIVDALDGRWAVFFVLTTLMILPSLYLLWRIKPKLDS